MSLIDIGNEIASLWGGSCYSYEINEQDQTVIFNCVEHGELFYVVKNFKDIRNEYHKEIDNGEEMQ